MSHVVYDCESIIIHATAPKQKLIIFTFFYLSE
jgi:hypothetical protein